jgi:hypothetical protein
MDSLVFIVEEESGKLIASRRFTSEESARWIKTTPGEESRSGAQVVRMERAEICRMQEASRRGKRP